MNGWFRRKIGEIGYVVTGRTPPTARSEYFNGPYPFITPSDMDGRRMMSCTERTLSEKGQELLKTIVVPKSSVAVSCIGWQLGKVVLTDRDSVTNQQINTLVPGDAVDCIFIYYLLTTKRDLLRNLGAMGVRTPIVNKSAFSAIEIDLPPLPVQRRIASILSAYDDLIENNTRRIAILEEIARRLYEEWFVHFRFPGHQEVSVVAGLPQGWKCVRLGDIAAYINRGLSPKYDNEAGCRVINQKCIRNQRLDMGPSRRQSKKVPTDKFVRFGDVLINSTGVGTLGRVAQVYEPLESVTVDSHVTIVRPSDALDTDFFGLSLLNFQSHFEGQGIGATGQTELSRARVAETELVLPTLALQRQFGEVVRPMRSLCIRLAHKNANLRAQRDLLLPKLVSGELDVSNAPLPDEEVVAA